MPAWPVLSSMMSVPVPANAVGSKIATGPSLPMSAVDIWLGAGSAAARADDGGFVEVVAPSCVLISRSTDVVLEIGRHRSLQGQLRVDGIGIVAGVAEQVAGGKCRGIGGREGREQRVAVAEIHALVAQARHGRRGRRVHDLRAQSIGNEQDEVVRRGGPCGCADEGGEADCRESKESFAHRWFSLRSHHCKESLSTSASRTPARAS